MLWALITLAGVLGAGCTQDASEAERVQSAEASLAESRQLGKDLDEATEHLEGRLLETQSNVHLWQEMAWRHQRVSALAVGNANSHFAQMVKMLDAQQEKARKLKRPHVASVSTVLTSAVASRKTRHGAE